MSCMLIDVPIIRPAKPIIAITAFLKIKINLARPVVWCHRVKQSNSAGIVRPNIDSVRAPNSDMNRSKLGMATANKTEIDLLFHLNYALNSET